MFIRSPYNYDREAASLESGLHCQDESKAVQSQKKEADINTLVKRFGLTGHMPTTMRLPQYGDFTGIGTYHEAQIAIISAQNEFMKLPADLRKRFNHDPQELLQFVSDKKNEKEAQKLGLTKYKEMAAEQGEATPKPGEAANSSKAEKSTS